MIKTIEENLESLSRTILNDAHTEADQILAEARVKADAIRQNAQAQAAAEREGTLAHATQEAQRLHSQAIATSELKARTLQLKHREQLLENVFKEVRKQLPSVEQWNDYNQVAERLLREVLAQLNVSKVTIRADEFTLKALTESKLEEIAKELNVTVKMGDPLAHGIGFIVETQDGHLQFDNTLETRLARMQNQVRMQIHHLLMGESL